MCSRRLLSAALAALLLAAGQPASAQEHAAERARLRARIDSLLPVRDSLDAELDAARRRQLETPTNEVLDTQRVGPLTVVTEPALRDAARVLTERALASFGPLADEAGGALDSTVLLIETGRGTRAFDAMRLRPGHRRVWLPRWRPASWRVDVIAHQVSAVLGDALSADLRNWLGGQGLPLENEAALREAYRALMSNPSPAVADCRAGRTERCIDALGLGDPGPRWSRWYSEPQLVAYALTQEPLRLATRELYAACDSARDAQTCGAYLFERGFPPVPFDPTTRRTFMTHVLELGGPAAWRRLTSDSAGTMHDRLVAAAGVPADSLFASWRSEVLAARPPHAAGLGGTLGLTLAWLAVALAFASRSTRWRLG